MKSITKAFFAVALAFAGILLIGCDSETHPDPHLIQSANAQRQAQTPGQVPPTGPAKQ